MKLFNLLRSLLAFALGIWLAGLFSQSDILLLLFWFLISACDFLMSRMAFLGLTGKKNRISKTLICALMGFFDFSTALSLIFNSPLVNLFYLLKGVSLIVFFFIFNSDDDFDNWTKQRVTKIIRYLGQLIEVPDSPQLA